MNKKTKITIIKVWKFVQLREKEEVLERQRQRLVVGGWGGASPCSEREEMLQEYYLYGRERGWLVEPVAMTGHSRCEWRILPGKAVTSIQLSNDTRRFLATFKLTRIITPSAPFPISNPTSKIEKEKNNKKAGICNCANPYTFQNFTLCMIKWASLFETNPTYYIIHLYSTIFDRFIHQIVITLKNKK